MPRKLPCPSCANRCTPQEASRWLDTAPRFPMPCPPAPLPSGHVPSAHLPAPSAHRPHSPPWRGLRSFCPVTHPLWTCTHRYTIHHAPRIPQVHVPQATEIPRACCTSELFTAYMRTHQRDPASHGAPPLPPPPPAPPPPSRPPVQHHLRALLGVHEGGHIDGHAEAVQQLGAQLALLQDEGTAAGVRWS